MVAGTNSARAGAFWGQSTALDRRRDVVDPSEAKDVLQGAYHLCLGREVFITGEAARRQVSPGEEVLIPSGQFALLLTKERVTIPADALGWISIRFGLKAKGLVNVSGFHVDPGFSGWLTFCVYNAGPRAIPVSDVKPSFLLWVSWLDKALGADEVYQRGPNAGRGTEERIDENLIANLAGEIASPGALLAQIVEMKSAISEKVASVQAASTAAVEGVKSEQRSLEASIKNLYTFLIGLLITGIGLIFTILVGVVLQFGDNSRKKSGAIGGTPQVQQNVYTGSHPTADVKSQSPGPSGKGPGEKAPLEPLREANPGPIQTPTPTTDPNPTTTPVPAPGGDAAPITSPPAGPTDAGSTPPHPWGSSGARLLPETQISSRRHRYKQAPSMSSEVVYTVHTVSMPVRPPVALPLLG